MTETPIDGTNNGGHNGAENIRLTSFAQLGTLLDLHVFPDASEPPAETSLGGATDPAPTSSDANQPTEANRKALPTTTASELADVVAQLAKLSQGLDSAARDDAHAREQATLDL